MIKPKFRPVHAPLYRPFTLCLLITFANSLDPNLDEAVRNIRSDLDPKFATAGVLKVFFENVDFEKKLADNNFKKKITHHAKSGKIVA